MHIGCIKNCNYKVEPENVDFTSLFKCSVYFFALKLSLGTLLKLGSIKTLA